VLRPNQPLAVNEMGHNLLAYIVLTLGWSYS